MTMEIGSLAEFLSAAGSIGALFAAAVAARAAIRANRQQSAQLRELEGNSERQRRADRTSQASRVAAWVWVHQGKLSFRYINSSRLPVWDFTAWVAVPGKLVDEKRFVLPPTSETRYFDGVAETISEALGNPEPEYWIELFESRRVMIAVTFRDSLNQWWVRDFVSQLREMESEEAALARVTEDFTAHLPFTGPATT